MNKDNIYMLPYSNYQYIPVKQLKEACLEVKEVHLARGGGEEAIIFHLRKRRNNKKCIYMYF